MLFNILDYKKFFEKELTLPELRDQKRGSPPRGNILVNKILNKGELQVGNKTVTIDKMAQFSDTPKGPSASWVDPNVGATQITNTDGTYNPQKAELFFKHKNKYRTVFKDDKDFEFRLDQIVKTKDFGSKGAGVNTKKFESIQAIFVAIKVDNPLVRLNPSNIERCYDKFIKDGGLSDVKLDPSLHIDYDLLEKYMDDPHWVSTFCDIPNRLWIPVDGAKKYIDQNIKYITYHTGYKGSDSPYINLLKKYKELSKVNGFTDIDYSKWCPADVYLIEESSIKMFNEEVSKVTEIYDLGTVVDTYFRKKRFIPFSLKKINVGDKFKIITNAGLGVSSPNFEITKFRINADQFGIASKIYSKSEWKYHGKVIDERDRVINFDSSDTSKNINIDGEVEGSTSKHGKISFPWLSKIIGGVQNKNKKELIGEIILNTFSELKSLTKRSDGEEVLQRMIREISENIKSLSRENDIPLSVVKVSKGTDTTKDVNSAISRLQSLQVIYAIMQIYAQKPELGNLIITKILRYALSIETDFFNSPMYLRVI